MAHAKQKKNASMLGLVYISVMLVSSILHVCLEFGSLLTKEIYKYDTMYRNEMYIITQYLLIFHNALASSSLYP